MIVPVAGSRLTEDILPPSKFAADLVVSARLSLLILFSHCVCTNYFTYLDLFANLKPQYVAPVTVWLTHESCEDNGGIFEAAGGWIGKYRWSRAQGKAFIPPETLNLESVRNSWSQITDMSGATQPATIHEQMSLLHHSLAGETPSGSGITNAPYRALEDGDENPNVHKFAIDDLILYALSVGATTAEPENLRFLYEGSEDFSALPTYGVIPCLGSLLNANMITAALKPYNVEFNGAKMLHGEQYLELFKPLPTQGTFTSKPRVVDVVDKGSGALLILEVDTFDESGEKVTYNQFALFLIGAGKFGGKKTSDKPEVRNIVEPPKRSPDVTVYEQTSTDQAALYRLTGDKNPMHIDPSFAALGGFDKPILHGLCTLGYASRHVLRQYAANDSTRVRAIKARFAGTLVPGQTLQTDMWREGQRIHFACSCKETGKPVIAGAYVDIVGEVLELHNQPMLTSVSDPNNPTPAELAFDTDDADALLTDVVFEEIGRRISMAPELAKKVNGIFTFVIVKDRKEVKTWTMDMKNETPGKLYAGHSKTTPADCIIRITDQDMTALAVGELDPVRAFMTGKLKIKGNLMATQRLQALFELNSAEMYENDSELMGKKKVEAASDENTPKMEFSPQLSQKWGDFSRLVSAGSSIRPSYDIVEPTVDYNNKKWSAAPYDENDITPKMVAAAFGDDDSGFSSPVMFAAGGDGSGDGGNSITCVIDQLFEQWLPTRLDEMKELVPVIKTCYQWNILQGGKVHSVWSK